MFERMRYIYPELETEISMAEYRLQKVIEEDSVTPPAIVWNKVAARVSWDGPSRGADNPTYVLQPRNYTMTVSTWWRCAVIAMGMIIIALLATTIYFFNRYHQLEERMMRMLPATEQIERTHK